jgi:hypothetical protein
MCRRGVPFESNDQAHLPVPLQELDVARMP